MVSMCKNTYELEVGFSYGGLFMVGSKHTQCFSIGPLRLRVRPEGSALVSLQPRLIMD